MRKDLKTQEINRDIECQAYGVCHRNSLTQTLQHCSHFGLKILSNNNKITCDLLT